MIAAAKPAPPSPRPSEPTPTEPQSEPSQEQLAAALFAAMMPPGVDMSALQRSALPHQAAKQLAAPQQPPCAIASYPQAATTAAGDPKKQPSTAKPAPPISPELQERIREAKAANFDAIMPAAYLQIGATQVLPADEDTGVYKAFFEQLMKEAGDIADPVEKMLLKGIAITFHRGGQLLVKAAQAPNLQAAALYNKAATNMYAEFRRQALSLEAYRASSAARRRADAPTQGDAQKQRPSLRCVP